MLSFSQSPLDPDFVQNPYPLYDEIRTEPLAHWQEYDLIVTARAAITGAALRDRRFGREAPPECAPQIPAHLAPFYDIEAHSMLELDGPRHNRLRRLVLKAFTSARIARLGPEITALAHELLDAMPIGGGDLLTGFCTPIPVIVIARMLGVPESCTPDLLRWSHAMVGMYQAGRTPEIEAAAVRASEDFVAFLRATIERRRREPGDDLISELIAAEENGRHLSEVEMISTCILLLNAGHEATVHTLGNGVKALLEQGSGAYWVTPARIDGTIEEILRHDPPLHLFTRWVHEEVELGGHVFARGDRIGLLLAGANRDPSPWAAPAQFDPGRPVQTNFSFGAGAHFCLGAPLARLEMAAALPVLFKRLPELQLAAPPRYAPLYHFHGLERLDVSY